MPAERTMVPGYRHVPGNHCGSTALRNLLAFHGLEISEEMALGLGAGVAFYYVVLNGQSPSRFTNGRVGKLEEQFVELTGIALRMQTTHDADESWRLARAAVDSGRPALLLSDLYYLDHYGKSARFPGHAVVLAGYDHDVAYLSDTAFEELQTTKLENLATARHAPARRRDRRLARGDRRLAMVRALQLPGDRAARDGRRQLPADVRALPRGGGVRGERARARGGGTVDRAGGRAARRERGRPAGGAALVGGWRCGRPRARGRGADVDRAGPNLSWRRW